MKINCTHCEGRGSENRFEVIMDKRIKVLKPCPACGGFGQVVTK